jgi:hypothetical protein
VVAPLVLDVLCVPVAFEYRPMALQQGSRGRVGGLAFGQKRQHLQR